MQPELAFYNLNGTAGVTYYFACVRWFSRDEEDGLIERDLCPGHHKGDNNPDMHYTAELFTSDVRGAGTDADVSLELFGHLGSSGPQNLHVCCRVLLFLSDSMLCHAMLWMQLHQYCMLQSAMLCIGSAAASVSTAQHAVL